MTDVPEPPTREERQQHTRAALIDAARDVFADMGYHAANLERIARQAGFSKGAVYSNFSGKSELFLAVLDANLKTVWGQPWGAEETVRPSSPPPDLLEHGDDIRLDEVIRGFALATLEFIAVASRDKQLSVQLQQRIQDVIDQYVLVAKDAKLTDDELSAEEISVLLTALDQGSGLLLLAGSETFSDDLLSTGMRRLLAPAPETGSDQPEDHQQRSDSSDDETTANSHIQERLSQALRKQP